MVTMKQSAKAFLFFVPLLTLLYCAENPASNTQSAGGLAPHILFRKGASRLPMPSHVSFVSLRLESSSFDTTVTVPFSDRGIIIENLPLGEIELVVQALDADSIARFEARKIILLEKGNIAEPEMVLEQLGATWFQIDKYYRNNDSTNSKIWKDSLTLLDTVITLSGFLYTKKDYKSFTINGSAISHRDSANWAAPITLKDGNNILVFSVMNDTGEIMSDSLSITFTDTTKPSVWTKDSLPHTTTESTIDLTFYARDYSGIRSLLIDSIELKSTDSTFETTVQLVPGKNTFTVTCTDSSQRANTRSNTYIIYYNKLSIDTINPAFQIIAPSDSTLDSNGVYVIDSTECNLMFSMSDTSGIDSVIINNQKIPFSPDDNTVDYIIAVPDSGLTAVVFSIYDGVGNSTTDSIQLRKKIHPIIKWHVSGVVQNMDDSTPLSNVVIGNQNGQILSTTDTEGQFSFEGTKSAQYTLTFTKPDFVTTHRDSVLLSPGQTIDSMRIYLTPKAPGLPSGTLELDKSIVSINDSVLVRITIIDSISHSGPIENAALPPGTFSINLNNNGFEVREIQDFTIVSPALPDSAYTIEGKFVDNDSNEITFTKTLIVIQDPPTINPGVNQKVFALDTVTFTGTASDELGTIVSYIWDFEGDGTNMFESDTSGRATFVYAAPGIYSAVFSVIDDDSNQVSDSIEITVENNAPRITAIRKDTIVSINDSVRFVAESEDREGAIAYYRWDFDNNGTWDYTNTNPQSTETYHSFSDTGTYISTFEVTDLDSARTTATCTTFVGLFPPYNVNAGNDLTVFSTQPVQLTATAEDSMGTIKHYRWLCSPLGVDTVLLTNTLSFYSDTTGTFTCTLLVEDDDRNIVQDMVSITIQTQGSEILITPSVTYQTIEGFGGYGGMKAWWESGPYYSPQWFNTIINEIGITMIRTELYPYPEEQSEYEKQIPFFKELKSFADESQVPLKVIGTVWTPPSQYKNTNALHGGSFLTVHTESYTTYLIDYLNRFKEDMTYGLYAISPANEPQVNVAHYNACSFTETQLANVTISLARKLNNAGLQSWISISEDLLYRTAYHVQMLQAGIIDDSLTNRIARISSMHGSTSDWNSFSSTFRSYGMMAEQNKRQAWNSEFGVGPDTWQTAFENAQATLYMLNHNYTAILYWLIGSDLTNAGEDNCLLPTGNLGPKALGAKSFFRYIRPGAIREDVSNEIDSLECLSFFHPDQKTRTIIVLNRSSEDKTFSIHDNNQMPAQWDLYLTGDGNKCDLKGQLKPGEEFRIPPKTWITLYNDATSFPVP